jgi:tRNA dimethylallyltransferase
MHFPLPLLQQCWFLAGPTASGKTAAGIVLAQRIGAEIIALDSMTLYREMDIGTAKPTAAERSAVPHHLLDILDPSDEFSVAQYLTATMQAAEEIVARGRIPLFVGGTGLYLRSLLRGVFEGPAADWNFRRTLETELSQTSPEALHERLAAVDSLTAARLHPNDTRRIIRALEIHHLTGRPASEQQQESPLSEANRPKHVYWLDLPRERLHDRINRRVDEMVAAGLIEEVRRLHTHSSGLSRTARQALGYKELLDQFDGQGTLDDAIRTIKIRTRQFAKRQCTWFRNLEECQAIVVGDSVAAEIVAETILAESQ